MVHDINEALTGSRRDGLLMSAANDGDEVSGNRHRAQLLAFLLAGIACWVPILALVYLFF
ncbi:MAG: hypothetical protein ISR50_00795 [Alphaproteobacteria bacterium]|nr:hypothetical protein [Alphaproteobacteria bacterium]MBL6951139.1 hypothetical protein [Alphaproteobacteria bacterium]